MFCCRLSIASSGCVGDGAAKEAVAKARIVKALRSILPLRWGLASTQ